MARLNSWDAWKQAYPMTLTDVNRSIDYQSEVILTGLRLLNTPGLDHDDKQTIQDILTIEYILEANLFDFVNLVSN